MDNNIGYDRDSSMNIFDTINANNYINTLKAISEVIKPKKSPIFIGRICGIGAIATLIYTIFNFHRDIVYIYFGGMATVFLGVFAFMILAWTNWNKKAINSILKKAEDDSRNMNYVTERVIVSKCKFDRELEREIKSKASSFSQLYRPMIMHDVRSNQKWYRFNGRLDDDYFIEYGTQLEVTYLATSRIINNISIADVEDDLNIQPNANMNVHRIKIAGEVMRVMTNFENGVYSYKVLILRVDGKAWPVSVSESIYYKICHRAEAIFELAMVFKDGDINGTVDSDLSKIEAAYVKGEDITEEEYIAQEEEDRAWMLS